MSSEVELKKISCHSTNYCDVRWQLRELMEFELLCLRLHIGAEA